MSRKLEFTFKSTDSNINIYATKWIPDGEVKAVLQITHGMTEMIERYDPFAKFLNEKGILVVGADMLGHGRTGANNNEDYGYFADYAGNWKLVSDIFRLKVIVKRDYPNVPYFLLGHSFGSLLTREYLNRYKDDIDGAIILGAMNKTNFEARTGKLLSRFFGLIHGSMRYKSDFINDLALGNFNKPFKDENLRNAWLTRDSDIVTWYNHQPECTFIFSVGAYRDMFDGILEVNKPQNIERINKNLPILLMSGDNDPVGDMGKGVKKLYNTYKAAGLNVRIKLYHEYRHEILNEIGNEQVFNDIYRWLNKNITLIAENKRRY